MSTPAFILREALLGLELVNSPEHSDLGWPAYPRDLPDSPDNAVQLKTSTPFLEGKLMRGGILIKHPGVQLTIRGIDENTAHDKGEELEKALSESIKNLDVEADDKTYRINNVHIATGLTYIGEERDTRRHLFTINVRLTLREITA